MLRSRHAASAFAALFALGCAPSALDDAVAETGIEGPFEMVPDDQKYDGNTARGPRIAAGTDTEVWAVTRDWADVEAEAGPGWAADSGLDWEGKFDAWIASFETEDRHHGSGETFLVPTPFEGRTFHAPTLECAEVALFLRATFASWYHLPFYVQGWDSRGRQALYAGHFGFVNSSGARIGNFPSFRTRYADHEGDWTPGQDWPSDDVLHSRRLGDDDAVEFLGEDAGAGAYFDAIYLNKRVGHFMRLLLLYFGSANLGDGANMFHVRPEATAAGDIVLHRWQRRGIGHVMPIFQVERHAEDALEVTVASGSMPRREPVWEEPNVARSRLTSSYAGSDESTGDGATYAALGGGVRRWRSARFVSGRWRNEVAVPDREDFINDQDHEAVGARPARFEEILRSLSVEERRDVALAGIEAAREHLRSYPASCAARGRREDAFEQLYEVLADDGMSRAAVDASYRTLEDYVFSALVYDQSRTCCWNRSTGAMHEIVMDYAEAEQAAASGDRMCVSPTVFRSRRDGYALWAGHAESLGRGAEWAAWSEDETCEQRDVEEDSVDEMRGGAAYCELGEPTTPPEPPTDAGCEATGASSQSAATLLEPGLALTAQVCAGESDYFSVEASGERRVIVEFTHADGDLDLEVLDADGQVIASSTLVEDVEEITATGPFFVRVYGYDGAANSYSIRLE